MTQGNHPLRHIVEQQNVNPSQALLECAAAIDFLVGYIEDGQPSKYLKVDTQSLAALAELARTAAAKLITPR